jgi:hypothetical protein
VLGCLFWGFVVHSLWHLLPSVIGCICVWAALCICHADMLPLLCSLVPCLAYRLLLLLLLLHCMTTERGGCLQEDAPED